MPAPNNLKKHVIKGGFYLTLRQILVAVLSLVNVLVVARALGPAQYGIVTITLSILYFLNRVLKLGLPAYLVRVPDLPSNLSQQMMAFYNMLGLIVCVLLWFIAPVFSWWTGANDVTLALRGSLPAVWLCMVSWISVSLLEREVRFVEVGIVEAVSQLLNYFVSITLVLMGWGFWGPVVGAVARYLARTLLAYRYHPVSLFHWRWQWLTLKPALRYGLAYSGSDWLLSLKDLRNSLLVSRLIGIEAAGIVGIAIRLVEQLAMLRLIVIRMSISVMAKLVSDLEKTRTTISKGMAYQAMLIGPVCALFACVSEWVIPLMFDERWLASANIFPLIAIGVLISSLFDIHASTLYAAGKIRDVAVLNFVYVGSLWGISALLMPGFGVWGYGMAEVLALPSFFIVHRSIRSFCGSPNYWDAAWIVVTTIITLVSSIFLSPVISTSIFIVSYGIIYLLNLEIRKLALELVQSVSKKRFS